MNMKTITPTHLRRKRRSRKRMVFKWQVNQVARLKDAPCKWMTVMEVPRFPDQQHKCLGSNGIVSYHKTTELLTLAEWNDWFDGKGMREFSKNAAAQFRAEAQKGFEPPIWWWFAIERANMPSPSEEEEL